MNSIGRLSLNPKDVKIKTTISKYKSSYNWKEDMVYRYDIELLHIPTNIMTSYSAPTELAAMTKGLKELEEKVYSHLFLKAIPQENKTIIMEEA